MTDESQTIVRRKLSHEVFDRLKALITSGELGPGDAMPSERDLMERFGVGRPAIREGMQALANLGLITINHGERARVQQLSARSLFQQVDLTAKILLSASPDSLEHLKQSRRFFERGMAREAAQRATPEDIAGLRATLDQQAKVVREPKQFIALDMRFHTQIAAISGNPIFEAVSEAMLSWLRQYYTEMLTWSGRENVTLVEHEQIIDQIARHDADGAEAIMVKHLDRSSVLFTRTS